MDCNEIFCMICRSPCHPPSEKEWKFTGSYKEIKDLKDKLAWLDDIVFLLQNNTTDAECVQVSCTDILGCQNGTHSTSREKMSIYYNNTGISIHRDCYSYTCKKIGYKLSYKHFAVANIDANFLGPPPSIKFPGISIYWDADSNFDFGYIVEDEREFLIESPLKNAKNAARIDKIIPQYKFNKTRQGPLASATFYKAGEIKIGENKRFWQKKNDKWVDIGPTSSVHVEIDKTNFELPKNTKKYLIDVPYFGHHNTIPLFIKKFEVVGKIVRIEFLGTAETLKPFNSRRKAA
jgi:hypothetical protein